MRQLQKNCREVWFARYLRSDPVLDEDGEETAETAPVYDEPQRILCNVSGAAGEWAVQAFGGFRDYSRTITITGDCPMKAGDRVWLGVSTAEPYNHIVTRVCIGLDESVAALKEVQVDG